jgi:hypothetical protein
MTTPNGPPSASTTRLFLVPRLPRSVGLGPVFFPPEPGLAQAAVHRLPLPVGTPQFLAFPQQYRPQLVEQIVGHKALKPAMHRTVVAKDLGQLIPLAAGAQPEDDPIQGPAQIDPRPAGRRRWVIGRQDRLQLIPDRIGDVYNGLGKLDR